MPVVLVYFEWFLRNSLWKCVLQPKIAKNSLKNPILGAQGRARSSMLVPLESSSAVLVMIRSKSVSICNHSRARLVDCSRNRTFSRGCPNLMRSYGGLLEPRLVGQALHRLNLRLMQTFDTQAVLVYLERFRRNSVLKCVLQPKIAKNSLKTAIFGVRGHSRSSMLVPLENSSAVLAMIRSKSASICNGFHARWANSGKITISKGWYPSVMPSFEGNPLTQRRQITS